MKLVTFRTDAQDRAGVIVGDTVIDLAHAFAWFEHLDARASGPQDVVARYGDGVLGFIERASVARPAADAIVRAWQRKALPRAFDGRLTTHPLAEVTLRAPIPRPPSMRDGYAFRGHAAAARRNRGLGMVPEFDEFPVFYFTNHGAVVGPGDVGVQSLHLDRLDYELEAAVVIGRECRNATAPDADDAVFGITVMNDWSARGLQLKEMKLSLGPAKGKDFATSLGPCLVTIDELLPRATKTPAGLAFDLEMRASVNGAPLSKGNLRDMTWTFAQLIERASYGATLFPGDVVASGTCATGCLLELNGAKATDDLWLRPGDIVVLEIDGIGKLENRIVLDTHG
ncbi:MAG TPA: fumarylacetoacetate hydrolase family protein [Polyangiaceae bacterium]|nr:fumarylacetoacetate hydrolase family protein [Polyangiaceae bacterium]